MHEGALSREELQTWVRNRYYYQTRIPLKDGLILAKSGDPAFRRDWIAAHPRPRRRAPGRGRPRAVARPRRGRRPATARRVERCEACCPACARPATTTCASSRAATCWSGGGVAHRAVRGRPHGRAPRRLRAALSLGGRAGLRYFRSRTSQAPRDARFGLRLGAGARRSGDDQQQRCVAALEQKCEILWRLLDAVQTRPAPAAPRGPRPARQDPRDGAHHSWSARTRGAHQPERPRSWTLCDGSAAPTPSRASCGAGTPRCPASRPTCTTSSTRWSARRAGGAAMSAPRPWNLVAELTYRCPLRCVYCSNPLDWRRCRDALDAAAWAACSPRPRSWACSTWGSPAASRPPGRTSARSSPAPTPPGSTPIS